MERVTLGIWLWAGKELGPEWESPGDVRANLQAELPAGTTVRTFLDSVAERYPPVRENVFPDHRFSPYVVVTLNHQGISREKILDRVLADGDAITVVPLIVGG